MKKLPLQLFAAIPGCIAALFFCCNTISDSVKVSQTISIPGQPFYRPETLFVYDTKQGVSFSLGGIRTCTTVTTTSATPVVTKDSLYTTITHCKDTIIMVNGSVMGKAILTNNDIEEWMTVRYNIVHPAFLGLLLADFIPDSLYDSILKTCLVSYILSEKQKSTIMTGLNTIVNTLDFFARYRAQMGDWITTNNLKPEVNRFIAEKIMIDTLGTLKQSLNEYEQEALKWFTIDIMTKQLDYAPDSTRKRMFKLNPGTPHIHKFLFQEKTAPTAVPTRKVIRFFATTSDHEAQVGYTDRNGFHATSTVKIADFRFITNVGWSVTPLFWPDVPFVPPSIIQNAPEPGAGVILYDAEKSSGKDTLYYDFKTYYPLCGQVKNDDRIITVLSSNTSVLRFSRMRYPPLLRTVNLYGWETKTVVHRMDTQGDTTIYSEKTVLSLLPIPSNRTLQ
jgi:hypothetical protein